MLAGEDDTTVPRSSCPISCGLPCAVCEVTGAVTQPGVIRLSREGEEEELEDNISFDLPQRAIPPSQPVCGACFTVGLCLRNFDWGGGGQVRTCNAWLLGHGKKGVPLALTHEAQKLNLLLVCNVHWRLKGSELQH